MPYRGKSIRDELLEADKRAAIAHIALTMMVDTHGLTGIDGVVDRLVYHAVMDASANGVLTNAHKIATRTKVPYTTVRRHLDQLREIGAILAYSRGWFGINPEYANSPAVVDRMQEICRTIEGLFGVLIA